MRHFGFLLQLQKIWGWKGVSSGFFHLRKKLGFFRDGLFWFIPVVYSTSEETCHPCLFYFLDQVHNVIAASIQNIRNFYHPVFFLQFDEHLSIFYIFNTFFIVLRVKMQHRQIALLNFGMILAESKKGMYVFLFYFNQKL